jgi:hypothetical protein
MSWDSPFKTITIPFFRPLLRSQTLPVLFHPSFFPLFGCLLLPLPRPLSHSIFFYRLLFGNVFYSASPPSIPSLMLPPLSLISLPLFGMWLGQDQDYSTWGKPQSGCSDICSYSKRATVGVRTTYATRRNSGMKGVKCGWTQPLFRKVSNHRFSSRNLKG